MLHLPRQYKWRIFPRQEGSKNVANVTLACSKAEVQERRREFNDPKHNRWCRRTCVGHRWVSQENMANTRAGGVNKLYSLEFRKKKGNNYSGMRLKWKIFSTHGESTNWEKFPQWFSHSYQLTVKQWHQRLHIHAHTGGQPISTSSPHFKQPTNVKFYNSRAFKCTLIQHCYRHVWAIRARLGLVILLINYSVTFVRVCGEKLWSLPSPPRPSCQPAIANKQHQAERLEHRSQERARDYTRVTLEEREVCLYLAPLGAHIKAFI